MDYDYKPYKGLHEGREISVKKFEENRNATLERIANEVAIASRISNHKNVPKLLGCCLETEFPILVYEFPTNGDLQSCIYAKNELLQLSWERKLRIVIAIANAVAYLHHGLSKTIIHRHINPGNIFLDVNDNVKLSNFLDAVPTPEGKTHVDAEICGTFGYMAPEVLMKRYDVERSGANDVLVRDQGRYTEKSDVFAFGVLLCDVLTGKIIHQLVSWHSELSDRASSNSNLLSDHILEEILTKYCEIYLREESRAQVLEYVKLVQRCVRVKTDERPNMIDVEKALRLIQTI